MSQYSTGTVTTTSGSNIVTGSSTLWVANASVGDIILIGSVTAWYEIASVDSDTQLTLTANFSTTYGGTSYVITRDYTVNLDFPLINTGDLHGADILRRAIIEIDAAIQYAPNFLGSVIDKDLTSAPTSGVQDEDSYIVGSPVPSGDAWAGYENYIAEWDADSGVGWTFTLPLDGDYVLVTDEEILYIYTDGAWSAWSVTSVPHTIASHTDTSTTGAQLDSLADNSMVDALHRHSELSASDGTPDKAFYLDTDGNILATALGPHSFGAAATNGVFLAAAVPASMEGVALYHDGSRGIIQAYDNGVAYQDLVLCPLGGKVGIGTSNPSHTLDVVGTSEFTGDMDVTGTVTITDSNVLFLSNVLTAATNKASRILSRQYDSAAETEGYMSIYNYSNSTSNRVLVGGGTSTANAATEVSFYTAANTTTRTGTKRLEIDTAGLVSAQIGFQSTGTGAIRAGRFITNAVATVPVVEVIQDSLTGAQACMRFDQDDIDLQFLEFLGTATSADLTGSIVAVGDVSTPTVAGYIKIFITDEGNQITDQAYFIAVNTLA